MRRRSFLALAALGLAPAAALGDPPTAEQQARWKAEAEDRLHNDWADLGRYRADNAALPPPAAGEPRVVFMGDSITQGWLDLYPDFFQGRPFIDRGISGQTTPQMLVRFRPDVIALKPAAVHIMAGINDIAGNTGPTTPEAIHDNLTSMAELAQAHGIRVIFASVLPAARFPWKPELSPAGEVVALNAWVRAYAASHGCVYADYYAITQDGSGGFKPGLAYDGVHPSKEGYQALEPLALAAIAQALAAPAPHI